MSLVHIRTSLQLPINHRILGRTMQRVLFLPFHIRHGIAMDVKSSGTGDWKSSIFISITRNTADKQQQTDKANSILHYRMILNIYAFSLRLIIDYCGSPNLDYG